MDIIGIIMDVSDLWEECGEQLDFVVTCLIHEET